MGEFGGHSKLFAEKAREKVHLRKQGKHEELQIAWHKRVPRIFVAECISLPLSPSSQGLDPDRGQEDGACCKLKILPPFYFEQVKEVKVR